MSKVCRILDCEQGKGEVLNLVLTSWWDVFETLANILNMVEQPNIFDPLLVNWQSTTPGISLFHPIPERNCSSAGIPGKDFTSSRFTTENEQSLFFFNREILSVFTQYSTRYNITCD